MAKSYFNSSYLVSKNLTVLLVVHFESVMEEKEEWMDPYDSIWLKLLTIVVYIIEIISAVIMMTFVDYETKGLAGHYRTLINQLLSYHYGVVRKYFKIFQIDLNDCNSS